MNNKTNNKTKRFPDNKYRTVHEFLYNAFYNEIRVHDYTKPRNRIAHPFTNEWISENLARRSSDKVHKVDMLNKSIHLDNGGTITLRIEVMTKTQFIIVTDTSKVPRRIYDFKNLYTTITKEDFYALYHTLRHSFDSILFQLTL